MRNVAVKCCTYGGNADSSSKMLQRAWKMDRTCCKLLQIPWKIPMENERFELKTVAHTVEMAVSSSKMLQIAWKMVRTGNPKKIPQTKKKKSPNNFLPLLYLQPGVTHSRPVNYSNTRENRACVPPLPPCLFKTKLVRSQNTLFNV